jgi:magnesium transporter
MDQLRSPEGTRRTEIDPDSFRGAHVLWVSRRGADVRQVSDLPELLRREDGFVWLDLPRCHTDTSTALAVLFGFHPLTLRDARRANVVPKAQVFDTHTFLILHGVEPAVTRPDLNLIELDQWVGNRFLVTTHGPLPGGLTPDMAFRDVTAVRSQIERGERVVDSPVELSNALVSSMATRMEGLLSELAGRADFLEHRVREADPNNTEALLDELYLVRNRFLMLRRTAARGRETYGRWAMLASVPDEVRPAVDDVVDQFGRLRTLCDEEKEGLTALVEFHEARVATKMNIAMERLALITAVLLPITAISSIYGMNVIVSGGTRPVHLFVVLAGMAIVSGLILRWTRRSGWW